MRLRRPTRCHLETDKGPHQRCLGALKVHVLALGITQPLLGAIAHGFGAWPIDFCGWLGDVGQHGYMIVAHFHVTSEDRQIVPLFALAVHQLALTEVGQESGMARQDAEITILTRDIQLIDLVAHEEAARCQDIHRQRHG